MKHRIIDFGAFDITSITESLDDLYKEGWILITANGSFYHFRKEDNKFGCFCDLNEREEPYKECVIDSDNFGGCTFAKEGMKKEECKYWRQIK